MVSAQHFLNVGALQLRKRQFVAGTLDQKVLQASLGGEVEVLGK